MEDLRINCPKCKTDYVTSVEEIHTARPEFHCTSCGSNFAFDFHLDLDFLNVPTYVTEGTAPNLELTRELPLESAPRAGLPGTPLLESLWCEILENYQDQELHRKFVSCAIESRRLPFASQQYQRILSVQPHDEIARAMSARILSSVEAPFVSRPPRIAQPEKKKKQPKLPQFMTMLFFVGVLMTASGVLIPKLKQVTAFGAAIISLSIGFRIILNKSKLD